VTAASGRRYRTLRRTPTPKTGKSGAAGAVTREVAQRKADIKTGRVARKIGARIQAGQHPTEAAQAERHAVKTEATRKAGKTRKAKTTKAGKAQARTLPKRSTRA
jgi:hypothetical protein